MSYFEHIKEAIEFLATSHPFFKHIPSQCDVDRVLKAALVKAALNGHISYNDATTIIQKQGLKEV